MPCLRKRRRQPRGPSLLPYRRAFTSWSAGCRGARSAATHGAAATPVNLTLRRLYPLGTTPGPECPGKRPEPNEIDYRGRDSRLTIIRTPRTVARRTSTRRRRRQGREAWSPRRPESVMGAKRNALVAGGVRGGQTMAAAEEKICRSCGTLCLSGLSC